MLVELDRAGPRVEVVEVVRVPRLERQHRRRCRELRRARVDGELVAELPEREQLGDRVGEARRLVRVLPLGPDPHVVVARHVKDAPEAAAELAQAEPHRVVRVSDVSGEDDGVVAVELARQAPAPLVSAGVVVVDVRHGEDARRRPARVHGGALEPPFVPRRAGGAEGGDRPLAALCELGRLRLPAQPVCKVPVGALLVAAGEGGEAGARVCLAPARSQRDGALAVLERRGPPSEPRVRGRAVRVQRLVVRREGDGLCVSAERSLVVAGGEGGVAALLGGRRGGRGSRRCSELLEHRSEALLEVCVGGVGGEARLVRIARLGVPPQREEREADPGVRARPARPSGERGTPVGKRIAVPVEVRAAGGAIGEQSASQLRHVGLGGNLRRREQLDALRVL
mmetsp:Transcript_42537/g.140943  ORF Transcript_42537/g.140943 Transcript_42537/m.140943 type:complete len:397 (+) Transcript_42537:585-1775(+)